jgi:4-hydroxy-4-methyl-2-oxoglutarate aldolase
LTQPDSPLSWGSDPVDKSISVAMLSDSCDRAGIRHQVLRSRLVPLVPTTRLSGRARTAQFVLDENVDPEHPYDDAIDFVDGANPGDLVVIATDESDASAFWGELFSAAAQGRKAVGMVTDGSIRDSDKIAALGFPVFSRSRLPLDFRGRMKLAAGQVRVVLGGVEIHPGDLIVADDDGIVVIPQAQEAQIVAFARQRASGESTVLEELLGGSTLRDVWTKHGIL